MPVGNPAPDFNPQSRPGDNLFTNSVVVLDALTGELKWWYQAVPNDGYDWDMSAAPVLYTTSAGAQRVGIAGKEGLLAGVDRTTHEAEFKTPITTILNEDLDPTPEGVRACPGVLGGVEWNGPTFDPMSRTIYVASVDWCATFTTGEVEYVAGELYFATGYLSDPTEEASGWVHAVNADDGTIRWRFATPKPVVAGVTSTAGGLLFTGDIGGTFHAFDKSTGEVVMALDAPEMAMYSVTLPEVNGRGFVSAQPAVVRGEQVFAGFCSGCHGARGELGVTDSDRRTIEELIAFIEEPTGTMPTLYPVPLDGAEVTAVATYVSEVLQGGR